MHLLSSENEPYCNYPPYLFNNYSATKPYYVIFLLFFFLNFYGIKKFIIIFYNYSF